MKILRHLPILLIFLSCNNSQQELFSINFPHINNHYKLLEIEKEDNLVRDPLIIESIKTLFSKDANSNTAYYGNWLSYYYISESENKTLILRVDEDKIFDEILIIKDVENNQRYCYHVAREYYDGYDFELLSTELKNDMLKFSNTISNINCISYLQLKQQRLPAYCLFAICRNICSRQDGGTADVPSRHL